MTRGMYPFLFSWKNLQDQDFLEKDGLFRFSRKNLFGLLKKADVHFQFTESMNCLFRKLVRGKEQGIPGSKIEIEI